jgi:ABC-type polysaccharide/polyol phosphate export permease
VTLLLAAVCTRYRDVPLVVQAAVQMLFFVTPVFWSPTLMPSRTILVHGNPLYHMLEVLRAPLLGSIPTGETWFFLMIMLVFGWAVTFLVFTKFRRRIPYWL